MARGLLFADIINTVSETYAREILTPEFGQRLDPMLRDRRDRLFGILNGIDTELYDPATDPHIAVQFRREQHREARGEQGRAPGRSWAARAAATCPLIGVVSRLIDQKGFDLIARDRRPADAQSRAASLIVMGTGESRYHDLLESLSASHPEPDRAFLTFNRPLEQRIYAGSDIFLMPSRFEPCGLNQMVAMRYGCVPVVHTRRRAGRHRERLSSRRPARATASASSTTTRWPSTPRSCAAVETYRHAEIWRQLVRRCMMADFSWRRSAEKYIDLYFRALAVKRQAQRTLSDYALARNE